MKSRKSPLGIVAPLAAQTKGDRVADHLRDRILRGEFLPDTQLTEEDVGLGYGVARPTAKAAIERLVGERLLFRDAHKTARVPLLTEDDIRDLYFSRLCLEREALNELCHRRLLPPQAVGANKEISMLGEESTLALIDPDIRFHKALVEATMSPRLSEMHETLMHEVHLCMSQVQSWQLLKASDIAGEHRRILDLIAAGDGPGALRALGDHLNRARDRLIASIRT